MILWPEFPIGKVLEQIDCTKPVLLVSARWRNLDEDASAAQLPQYLDSPVRLMFSWQEFDESNVPAEQPIPAESGLLTNRQKGLCWNIYACLRRSFRQSETFQRGDVVTILQISDMQFGDPDRVQTFLEVNETVDALRKNNCLPDFIAICGDVAYSGSPAEYMTAEKWLTALLRRLWPGSDYRERIVIVPGNHDVNLQISASAQYKYEFDTHKLTKGGDDRDNWHSSRVGFGDFAARVTGDSHWLDMSNRMYRIYDRFINQGVRFVLLNTASEVHWGEPASASVNEKALEEICNVALPVERPDSDMLTIVVAHNGCLPIGPMRSGETRTGAVENGDVLERALRSLQCQMYLHGHGHKFTARDVDIAGAGKMVQAMCASPHLGGRAVPQDTARGFNVIRARFIDEHLKSIDVLPFAIREGVVRPPMAEETKHFEIPIV